MSQQNTQSNSFLLNLNISGRDLRVFCASTLLLTSVFTGAVKLDGQYNGGRFSQVLVSNTQVASADTGICSAAKYLR